MQPAGMPFLMLALLALALATSASAAQRPNIVYFLVVRAQAACSQPAFGIEWLEGMGWEGGAGWAPGHSSPTLSRGAG
eukprot:COSAG05_NODE_1604_length_4427_cov_5.080869_2_plen_78_part_00